MENKPIYDKLSTIKFTRSRETYKSEHEREFGVFQMAKRELKPHFNAEGKLPITKWKKELEKLDEEIAADPGKAEYQEIKAELDLLRKIQYYAKTAMQDRDLLLGQ